MLLTVAVPSIWKGAIIFNFWEFSITCPSQSLACTVSPTFANGVKSHTLSASRGSVYCPLFRNTPSILSKSFCRPS